jgi:hypothetical protein
VGLEVQVYSFLTSALDGGEWSTPNPGHFIPVPIESLNRWLGGLQSRSDILGQRKHICPFQVLTLDRLACSLVAILTELSQLLIQLDMLLLFIVFML